MRTLKGRTRGFVTAVIFAGLTTSGVVAKAQLNPETNKIAAPLEPLRPGITVDGIFARLNAQNELRKTGLRDYTALRRYQVADVNGEVQAEKVGRMEYHAPDQKRFVVSSETGSGMIRRMALNPLVSNEIEAGAVKKQRDSSLTPANYTLELIGEQQVGPYRCFVARVTPKRSEKYLFEGTVWIDTHDYAIVRIEGHPAKKLSFWIQRADFVRQYQKIGKFWLPQRDETLVQVRLYGKSVVTIDHQDYLVNGETNSATPATAPETVAWGKGDAN